MIALQCPACGKAMQVRDQAAGKPVRCSGCHKPVTVPNPASPPAPTEATARIGFPCPHCGNSLQAPAGWGGREFRCGACKQDLRIPVAAPTPALAAQAAPSREPGALAPPAAPARDGPVVSVQCTGCGKTFHNVPANVVSRLRCRSCNRTVVQVGTAPAAVPAMPVAAARSEVLDTPAAALLETIAPNTASADGVNSFLAPAEAPGEIGRLGQYRVIQVLGKGGMGIVYRAEDPLLRRTVALKVMLPGVAEKAENRQRFLREAQAAAAIKHDHIVTIYQVGEDRGVPFMAMEFLQGEPLDARLGREGKLTIGEALRIGREAAEGLAAAHQSGLIHRDIKPANIWLETTRKTQGGRVKILDFGLARVAEESVVLTRSGSVLGTPAYMAPEQARSEAVDGRSDLFSLGCVLYHMTTGERPFKGTDVYSVLISLATDTPPAPAALNPAVPAPLSDYIVSLLAKKPVDRPASAADVAEALEAMQADPTLASVAAVTTRPTTKVTLGLPDTTRQAVLTSAVSVLRAAGASTRFVLKPRGRPGSVVERFWKVWVAVALLLVTGLGWLALAPARKGPIPQVGNVPLATPAPGRLPQSVTNSIGMNLVLLPAAKFKMGSPAGEAQRGSEEEQHEVEISQPFYMGVYEVTQKEYTEVMGTNPSDFSATGAARDKVKDLDTALLPVEMVSWQDAKTFCERLSARPEEQKLQRSYRLPTEAEWEYACRGGTSAGDPFSFGKQLCSDWANFHGSFPYGGAPRGPFLARTTPKGSFPANAFGLHDMHGNVAEWCANWHEGFCVVEPGKPPPPKVDRPGRAVRGGAWAYQGPGCRTANRTHVLPDDRSPCIGFRVVLGVDESKPR